MAYSLDGVNWTAMTNPLGKKNNITNIAYGNGKYVVLGYGNMAYSDGIDWIVAASFIYVPIFSSIGNDSNGIAYGDGKLVAVGTGGKMSYSPDGITWITIADSTFGLSDINDIVYANGKFVAVGSDGKMAYWDGTVE